MDILLTGIIILILIWAYSTYVSLIKQRNRVMEAVSSIDVYLQKRADVVPNMLKIAKKYMEQEGRILRQITRLRNSAMRPYNKNDSGSVSKHMVEVQKFDAALERFQLQVEDYPELKSDKLMLRAQNSIEDCEDDLQAARRFYNAEVNLLKNKVEIFPGSLIASMINIETPPFFIAARGSRNSLNI